MTIVTGDILYKLSVSAAAGNTTAQATPSNSLGDQVSTTQVTTATLHNLFDVVTGDENVASDVEYRCFFVHNNHATDTWSNVVAWLSAQTTGGATAVYGLDPAGVTPKGQASAQAATNVAVEGTAPTGVTFLAHTTKAAAAAAGGLIGTIPAGSVAAIWVRRSAANSAALLTDGVQIRVEGDSP